MDEAEWDVLLDINLSSTERIDQVLLDEDVLSPDGRIVGVSSISGIAGNRGQVNYATSKAGVIGRVEALSRQLRGAARTINAVAPGFIETQMTDAMPFGHARGRQADQLARPGRQAGRRRRDRRVVRRAGVGRAERQRHPRLRPAAARGMSGARAQAARLLRKAFAGALPVPLPGRSAELTDDERTLDDVEIDREHLAAYNRVCGFRLTDELPPTYLHVVAFPLALSLMTARSFPFGVIGLVHIENRIEQRAPGRGDERPSLRVRAENLRDHEKGRAVDLVGEATIDGEVVWRDVSTYLRRGGGGRRRRLVGEEAPSATRRRAPTAQWKVPGDIGRRYADVSGDRNPIHLHPLSAKLFGMPGAIAHGMWVKARCLAALEGLLPDGARLRGELQGADGPARQGRLRRLVRRRRSRVRGARRAQGQAAPHRAASPAS